jgi:hypothetical protein
MKNLAPSLAQSNAAVCVAFMRKIGAPEWRLMVDAKVRSFGEKSCEKMTTWVAEMQANGKPVLVLLPTFEDGHWFLTARLPLSASPAALRPAPQVVIAADDFTALWRLAEPITAPRAADLVSRIIGSTGKAAIGEPVPLPGTILLKTMGVGLAERFPVRILSTSPSPGYRILGDDLVDVRRSAAAEKLDPRRMAVKLADDAIWQPDSNGFLLIVGASGGGKTEAIKTVGAGVRKYGIPVLTFDFHGDVAVPGSKPILLASGSESTLGINPLELLGASAGRQGLYDQRRAFCALVRRACPALGHKQANLLKLALETAYLDAGILDNDPSTWGRPPPRMADLMRELTRIAEDDQNKAGVVEGLNAIAGDLFGHPIFHRDRYVGLDALLKDSVRLDLSALEDGEKMVVTETLLRRIFAALQAQGPIPVRPVDDAERFRLFVIIDEVQKLVDGGGAEILDILFRESRKFGLGMILGTQSASNLTKDIRANASCWLALLHNEMEEARRTAPNLSLDPDDLMKLRGKGDGYFKQRSTATRRIQVQQVV